MAEGVGAHTGQGVSDGDMAGFGDAAGRLVHGRRITHRAGLRDCLFPADQYGVGARARSARMRAYASSLLRSSALTGTRQCGRDPWRRPPRGRRSATAPPPPGRCRARRPSAQRRATVRRLLYIRFHAPALQVGIGARAFPSYQLRDFQPVTALISSMSEHLRTGPRWSDNSAKHCSNFASLAASRAPVSRTPGGLEVQQTSRPAGEESGRDIARSGGSGADDHPCHSPPDSAPRVPVPLWYVPPRDARPGPEPYPADELPLHPRRRTPRLLPSGQQRLQHGPLRIR